MMSISPGMSAGHAGGYFSREDYYLRGDAVADNSLWVGRGSQDLGLEGPVRENDFRALCRGEYSTGNRLVSFRVSRDPDTGALIERHRAGNDCTFSAPKSVSVAYAAGMAGMKEAHDKAVLSVLSHVEDHYSHYRSPGEVMNGGGGHKVRPRHIMKHCPAVPLHRLSHLKFRNRQSGLQICPIEAKPETVNGVGRDEKILTLERQNAAVVFQVYQAGFLGWAPNRRGRTS